MDIFAELEKLRMPTHECEEAMGFSGKKCHCGNHEHNETLGGIIEWLKTTRPSLITVHPSRLGCMVGEKADVCMIDDGQDINECHIAEEFFRSHRPKTDCQYWKEPKE